MKAAQEIAEDGAAIAQTGRESALILTRIVDLDKKVDVVEHDLDKELWRYVEELYLAPDQLARDAYFTLLMDVKRRKAKQEAVEDDLAARRARHTPVVARCLAKLQALMQRAAGIWQDARAALRAKKAVS